MKSAFQLFIKQVSIILVIGEQCILITIANVTLLFRLLCINDGKVVLLDYR